MVVEARRDSCESAVFALQNLEDVQEVFSVAAGNFSLEETMTAVAEGVSFSWTQRISRREREVLKEEDHHRLRLDLIVGQ